MAGKEKIYEDDCNDLLEVDTETASDVVYFTSADGSDGISSGRVVSMNVEQVKKIRKQLKKWLEFHGHNEPL